MLGKGQGLGTNHKVNLGLFPGRGAPRQKVFSSQNCLPSLDDESAKSIILEATSVFPWDFLCKKNPKKTRLNQKKI